LLPKDGEGTDAPLKNVLRSTVQTAEISQDSMLFGSIRRGLT
jgi:hypothetical protein